MAHKIDKGLLDQERQRLLFSNTSRLREVNPEQKAQIIKYAAYFLKELGHLLNIEIQPGVIQNLDIFVSAFLERASATHVLGYENSYIATLEELKRYIGRIDLIRMLVHMQGVIHDENSRYVARLFVGMAVHTWVLDG